MKLFLILSLSITFSAQSFASGNEKSSEYLTVTVTDITRQMSPEIAAAFPAPSPKPSKPKPSKPKPSPTPVASDDDALPTTPASDDNSSTTTSSGRGPVGDAVTRILGDIQLSDLITLGQKVWDFIINNKPTADYQEIKSSVVPNGITSWSQLTGWSKPVSKYYHVEFKNIFGGIAGSFDYRISFLYGGGYKGKGKYLGQINFTPANIQLHTDRSLTVKAKLSEPLNFGTESNPIAGVSLQVNWTSPTTTRYQMNSAEYFIYGSGEIQDLTNGSFEQL